MKHPAGALLAGLLAAACGQEAVTASDGDTAPPVLAPVVTEALAAAERAVLGTESAPVEPAEAERVRGLVVTVAGSIGSMRALAIEEAQELGDAAVPELARVARAEETADDDRAAALELLGAIDTPRAAGVLLELCETSEQSWQRAHAAWRMAGTAQDWVVPRLLLRLKYEKDHDTVIWIANTLAHFGNYSGLGVLDVVTRGGATPELKLAAAQRLDAIAAEADYEDAASLWSAWRSGTDEPRFAPERSPRYERELWRLVARFTEFQLRGVDDSRYVLEALGPRAAELLGEALRDQNLYVRVHAAQSLERMGPRGAPAGPALVRALGDPDLAPNAAAALGGLRYTPAEAELAALCAEAAPDLRLAAARALGGLGSEATPAAADALRRLLESDVAEERQAAAESLAFLGAGDEVARRLATFLTSDEVEPVTSEHAARAWLWQRAADDEAAATVLASWDALAIPTDVIVPNAERHAARQSRRTLLEEYLDSLGVR